VDILDIVGLVDGRRAVLGQALRDREHIALVGPNVQSPAVRRHIAGKHKNAQRQGQGDGLPCQLRLPSGVPHPGSVISRTQCASFSMDRRWCTRRSNGGFAQNVGGNRNRWNYTRKLVERQVICQSVMPFGLHLGRRPWRIASAGYREWGGRVAPEGRRSDVRPTHGFP